jgi:hypothetical protein
VKTLKTVDQLRVNGCDRSSPSRIERPDRELASRQRPPFIPVHGQELLRQVGKNCRQLEVSISLARYCASPGLRITERTGEQVMARRPYATKINLGFGNVAGKFANVETGIRSGNFARERLNLLRKYGI